LKRPKLVCVKCSSDEKNNPTIKDIELSPMEEEFFGDTDAEFETWECPKCNYRIWVRTNLENPVVK